MATGSLCLFLRRRRTIAFPLVRHLSSLPLPSYPNPESCSIDDSSSNSKPPSLSSRLSFVFDQLDSLNRLPDLSAQDAALRKIRSWRQPSARQEESRENERSLDAETETKQQSLDEKTETLSMNDVLRREVELVHPWPEWIELMEQLAKQNYFEVRRTEKEEQRVAADVAIDLTVVEEGPELDISRDWRTVKNACWNFSRDRFDIIRKLQRKDIEVLVGHGCPSMEMKVVFSAKLLRKLVHLNEGDVCSACNLRNSCSRGYILTPKEDEARTLDIMRILLNFGFEHINGSVENKDLMKLKSIKNVARKLMHEIVRLSAVPIDPNLTPPVVRKPPPKVKQPPPPPKKKRIGRDDVEMKKGDWLCPKCDFMNFAKNTDCLQCDAKRPKRQLLPGEWECPRCKFLNYRRNMACYECENQRPPDEYTSNQAEFRETGRPVRSQPTRLPEVSDAWNFDFDENESDGADVAAFEFADSSKQRFENEYNNNMREGRPGLSEMKPDTFSRGTGKTGFDDFDDEDDDDLDNYEIMKGGNANGITRKSFSELEVDSDPEEYNEFARGKKNPRERDSFTASDNDEEIVKHSYGSRNNNKSGGKGMDSEDEFQSNSDDEDFRPNQKERGRDSFNELDSDREEDFPSTREIKLKERKFGSTGDFGQSKENSRSRSYNNMVSDGEESWDRRRGNFGNNSGFRGRKNDSLGNNGGFRGWKDDSCGNNGGFRGPKDDSFGGRKGDSFGNNGAFRGRKNVLFGNIGGFRGRKDNSFGNNGGFSGPKKNERGRSRNDGFERGKSNGDRGRFGDRKSNGETGGFGRERFDDFGNNGEGGRPRRRANLR